MKCYSGDSVLLRNPYSIEHKKHQQRSVGYSLAKARRVADDSLGDPKSSQDARTSGWAFGRIEPIGLVLRLLTNFG